MPSLMPAPRIAGSCTGVRPPDIHVRRHALHSKSARLRADVQTLHSAEPRSRKALGDWDLDREKLSICGGLLGLQAQPQLPPPPNTGH